MKKILVFGASDQLGGTESYLLTLYENLDRNQIQFDFLFPHDIENIPYEYGSRYGSKVYIKNTIPIVSEKKLAIYRQEILLRDIKILMGYMLMSNVFIPHIGY